MAVVYVAHTFLSAASLIPSILREALAELIWGFRSDDQPAEHSGIDAYNRLENVSSENIWTVSCYDGLSCVIHRDKSTCVFIYVARSLDDAIDWGMNCHVEQNSITGAWQVFPYSSSSSESSFSPPLSKADLLQFGLPSEIADHLLKCSSFDELLDNCLKFGVPTDIHASLQRLFRNERISLPKNSTNDSEELVSDRWDSVFEVNDLELLQNTLKFPRDEWISFPHPTQRRIVEYDDDDPILVIGRAGTGKTAVAVLRAKYLARQGYHVLFTTFTNNLVYLLELALKKVCSSEEYSMIRVTTIDSISFSYAKDEEFDIDVKWVNNVLFENFKLHASHYNFKSLFKFWREHVSPNAVISKDEFNQVIDREGAIDGLNNDLSKKLWPAYASSINKMFSHRILDFNYVARIAYEKIQSDNSNYYDAIIVDEVQDLSMAKLKIIGAMYNKQKTNLLMCGDTYQSIYPGGNEEDEVLLSKLNDIGIENIVVEILNVNYRNTKQIMEEGYADNHVPSLFYSARRSKNQLADLPIIVNVGSCPVRKPFESETDEFNWIIDQINSMVNIEHINYEDIAVVSYRWKEIEKFSDRMDRSNIPYMLWRRDQVKEIRDGSRNLNRQYEEPMTHWVTLSTLHGIKGMEFFATIILGEETVPFEEQNLLHVGKTRPRSKLLITSLPDWYDRDTDNIVAD